jgi:hypothetical protein
MKPISRVGKGGRGVAVSARFHFPPLPTLSGVVVAERPAKSDRVGKGARGRRIMRSVVLGAFAHPTIR